MYNNNNLQNYSQISKKYGFYDISETNKIIIYGKDSYNLLNKYSIRNVYKINKDAFYTILMDKKKFLGEVLVIRTSPYKFILCSENENTLKKIHKKFNNVKRKFPYLTIDIDRESIAVFSLHGKLVSNSSLNNNNIFNSVLTNRQTYYHTIIYSTYLKKDKIKEYLFLNNYKEITIDNYNLFLYNNKVITNINKIKSKFKLSLIKNFYGADNYNFKCKPKIITIKLFESTQNIALYKNMKIYNNNHKKIGYVHRSFHNPNKKNPFILSIVYKFRTGKLALIKDIKTNKDILIKQRNIYN